MITEQVTQACTAGRMLRLPEGKLALLPAVSTFYGDCKEETPMMTGFQLYVQQQKEAAVTPELNAMSGKIVDAAFAVHSRLGPGLLESVYEACLAYELRNRKLSVRRQVIVPITYEELEFEEGYRLDLLVEESVIVELKAVSKASPLHVSQVLTYLKLSGHKLGLLLCFNNTRIKQGITRLIN